MQRRSNVCRPMRALATVTFLLAISALTSRVPAAESLPSKSTAADDARIIIVVGNQTLPATLANNSAAHDFASQLPLDLSMDDLFEREKFARIPKPVDQGADRTWRFRVGDIAYWSPKQDIAIYYREDGGIIPPPGLIPIGRLDGSADAFAVRGPIRVHIELAK
jgi:hypothetical protein